MEYKILIPLVLFYTYTTITRIKFKRRLDSVSNSAKQYMGKKTFQWQFTAFAWAVGLSVILGYYPIFDGAAYGWFFASGAMLIFVGAAWNYWHKWVGKYHYLFSVLCILFGFLATLCIDAPFRWVPLAIYVVSIPLQLFVFKTDDFTWVTEHWAVSLIIVGAFVLYNFATLHAFLQHLF
jgi:hypothetical protein